jgi:hypothetical protein
MGAGGERGFTLSHSPDWLVREEGEWRGGTERGFTLSHSQIGWWERRESEEEEQVEVYCIPFPRLAGERGGRVKRRNRERIYCTLSHSPDWLVREKGEWRGGTVRGLLYSIPQIGWWERRESEEEEQREGLPYPISRLGRWDWEGSMKIRNRERTSCPKIGWWESRKNRENEQREDLLYLI